MVSASLLSGKAYKNIPVYLYHLISICLGNTQNWELMSVPSLVCLLFGFFFFWWKFTHIWAALPFLHQNFPWMYLFSVFDYWSSWHAVIHSLDHGEKRPHGVQEHLKPIGCSRASPWCSNMHFTCPSGNKRKDNVLGVWHLLCPLPEGGKWK